MHRVATLLIAGCCVLGIAAGARAARQGVPTKLLLVKDPPSGPAARKIVWKVKHPDMDESLAVVGDPTVGGAMLRIKLNVSNHCSNPPCDTGGGDQCVVMPAGGWSPIRRYSKWPPTRRSVTSRGRKQAMQVPPGRRTLR